MARSRPAHLRRHPARDTPVIMGAFIVMSVTVALASLATDLVYAALDPRVKLS